LFFSLCKERFSGPSMPLISGSPTGDSTHGTL
jgi:hypothetical protein